MNKGLFDRLQQELEAREKRRGVVLADLRELSGSLRALVRWMIHRKNIRASQAAAFLGRDEAEAAAIIQALLEKGFVRELVMKGETYYRVRLLRRRRRRFARDMWKALNDRIGH